MIRFSQMSANLTVTLLLTIMISQCNAKNQLRGHLEKHQNKHLHSSGEESSPIKIVLLGIICIIGAFSLLWQNERRQAITAYRLKQAKNKCTSVNSAEVNPNTNQQLIHTNGKAEFQIKILGESRTFHIICDKYLVYSQKIMYQWILKSKSEDDSIEYYYELEWSSTFHGECEDGYLNDQNKWIVEQETQINQNIFIGAYLMSKSLAEQTNVTESIPLNSTNAQAVAHFYGTQRGFQNFEANGKYIYFQQTRGTLTLNDLRVSFNMSKTGPTTIISQQYNHTFTPYIIHDKYNETLSRDENVEDVAFSWTKCCCFCCNFFRTFEKPLIQIDWIFEQILTKNQVFKKKRDENIFISTSLRLAGYLLMGFGFYCLFYPITWLISWFPLVGNFLSTFSGIVFFLISFIISIPFSILTIAFAWLFYHPKQAIWLILLSGLIGAGILFYIKTQG